MGIKVRKFSTYGYNSFQYMGYRKTKKPAIAGFYRVRKFHYMVPTTDDVIRVN